MSKVLLMILDGWGHSESRNHNSIKLAHTPNYNKLISGHPHSLLNASGLAVGLPDGQMGNSEVGHITIGSGRVLLQELPRISQVLSSGKVKINLKSEVVHLIALISDGGVHSHIEHIIKLADLLRSHNAKVKLHVITDGRDVAPKSALKYLQMIKEANIEIATVSGRFYAMDRDKRWERTRQAYNAIVNAVGSKFTNPAKFVEDNYAAGVTDEFIVPGCAESFMGIKDGDAVIFANFRADRMRQISASIADPEFSEFERNQPQLAAALMMTQYSERASKYMQAIFAHDIPEHTLGAVVAQHKLRQIRIAETEKYAHVTYFFNGGREEQFDGEERVLIPSPKVATYDLQPEMSAHHVADAVIKAVVENYDLIVVNFANADMVGHSGVISAAVKAVESVDQALGRIIYAIEGSDYDMLVTADHGNAEEMVDSKTGQPLTSHTTNLVPFIYYGTRQVKLKNGTLADIAPTVLNLLGIEIPKEMNGRALF